MTAGARRHTAGDTRQDTQKAAGELQGRAHATDRHTEQATGTGRRKGTQQDTHGSHGTHNRQERTGTERADRQKKEYVIFKGERREKRRRDSQTHVNVCIYILPNIVA